MKENLKSIVLGTIRHSDRHNVASVFTLERGRMAFLTPVGATKKGRASASRLMPLAIVEIQANISANRDLHIPSAVNPVRMWRNLYYDPHKAGVVMFLSEFLQRLLREAAPEPTLWRFIADSLTILDETADAAAIANFHITFLISLMPLMGISPDISNFTEGMEFDMKGARWCFLSHRSPQARQGWMPADRPRSPFGAYEFRQLPAFPLQRKAAQRTARHAPQILRMPFPGMRQPEVARRDARDLQLIPGQPADRRIHTCGRTGDRNGR